VFSRGSIIGFLGGDTTTIKDLPDYTKLIAVNVAVPDVNIGPLKTVKYQVTPGDLADGDKAYILSDVKGRPIVVVYGDVQVDHRKILGVALKSPYVAQCVPTSIENPALAYDSVNDLFKVRVDQWNIASITADVSDKWARQLGQMDIARVLGAAPSATNPLAARLTTGSAYIDPRDRNWNLSASDVPDLSDRAARQLGRVYGSQGAQLLQRATTYDTLVQLRHNAAEIDPRDRNWTITEALARSWNLGASDVPDLLDRAARILGKVYGSLDVLQQQATTKELLVQIAHAGTPKDPTQIRALTTADEITAKSPTAANLKMEPTQTTRTNLTVMPEREDATNLGGTVSPNNAGVQIVAPSGSLKPKVYDAGYHAGISGLHYFYFGTSTTATTRRFCTLNSTGLIHKTFVTPRVGNAADGIYLFASVSDPNIPYDLNYVLG